MNNYAQISGTVIDIKTKEPLSNVNIIKKHSGFGVSSDKSGSFDFEYLKIGDTLIISHISYQKEVVVIKKSDIIIQLIAKTNILQETAVFSKKTPKKVIENPWVIDYEIINDSSILIAKVGNEGSRLELLIKNKSKAFQFSDIDKIEQNCLGDIYVIRKDTAYNVLVKEGELYFSSFLLQEELELANTFCDDIIDNIQYFNNFTALNKLNIFSILQDTTPYPFYRILDKESYKYTASHSNELKGVVCVLQEAGGHRMGDNYWDSDFAHKQSTYSYVDDLQDYVAVLTKLKTISKLIEYQNQLIILDNVNSEIIYFNNEHQVNYTNHFQLIFKNTNIKKIIQDNKTEYIYYLVKGNNKTNIYRFDFENLSFKFVMSRSKHIEEVKINNGLLYYLDYNIYNETRELYKIAL